MFGLGMGELIVIAVIALIFIGPKKLPELAKGIGQGIREFKHASSGLKEEMAQSINRETSEKTEIGKKVDVIEAEKIEKA
jgi:TatA/E family protein of Tat protein translocase